MKKLLSSSVTDNIKNSAILAQELNVGIEISRFPNFSNIETDFESIILQMQKNLITFSGQVTLHGMFFDLSPASNDPAVRAISQKRHHQSLKAAKAINAETVVFHSGNKGMKHKISQEKFRDNSIKFWNEFIKEFEDSGIVAVIENVHERKPEMISNIVNEVNSDYLKYSLDTGHANLFSEVPITEWIQKYGHKLHHMHIHNNFGNDDEHNSLLKGTIDFHEIFKSLKENNINPIFVFEIFKQNELIESIEFFEKTYGEKLCTKN